MGYANDHSVVLLHLTGSGISSVWHVHSPVSSVARCSYGSVRILRMRGV